MGPAATENCVSLERIMEPVQRYWGFNRLRPLQEDAIRAGLTHRDSVVVMPTGGGKSLCYQVPPVVLDCTDVVVSPLISLMKDQVDGLAACGYPAAALHSGMTAGEQREAIDRISTGMARLIFVSPERILTPGFLGLMERARVRAFAIDEAHCISHWGHDFRPEYRQLATLKERFPHASVHAYTATATQRVREDIAVQLRLHHPAMLVGRFDRPNLVYRIVPRVDPYEQTAQVLRRQAGQAAIVYCLSRKDTEQMAEELRGRNIEARPYHAGMNADVRRRTQDMFSAETLDVVTATVAFGMGIDRSNVRCVVHATMPKSIEHYQQETGRAGRDGLEAECVLLYSAADVMRWESLIAHSAQSARDPAAVIAAASRLLTQMRQYCGVLQCRHRALTEYFGQQYERPDCGACDVCLGETEGAEDETVTAQKILSCVFRVEQRFGVTHVVDVLQGADTEMVRKCRHDRVSTYGLLKDMPRNRLQNYVYQLADQGLVERTAGDRPVLRLNDASWEVLRGRRRVMLIQPKERVKVSRVEAAMWEGVDRGLFDRLRELRRDVALENGVPAFVIFGDDTLRNMARLRPTSREGLKRLHGVGKLKLEQFGYRFAAAVAEYCGEHGLATDVARAGNGRGGQPPADGSHAAAGKPLAGSIKARAFDMFAQGRSIEDVAAMLDRAPSTTASYLGEFILLTRPESVAPWVDDATYQAVARAADELGDQKLKPLFDKLEGKVPYEAIRCVLNHLRVRQ